MAAFTEEDFRLASQCKGPYDNLPGNVANAAVKVAGSVEAIARDEGVSQSQAELIFCERHRHLGFYYSVVNRCVTYDREF